MRFNGTRTRIDNLSFALYDTHERGMRHVGLRQLLRCQGLFARAENSGCEACYVEVAKWNRYTRRWERFAFQKCFGGEVWKDLDDTDTCVRIAALINRVQNIWGMLPQHHTQPFTTASGKVIQIRRPVSICEATQYEVCSFIHGLPTWTPTRVVREAQKPRALLRELLECAELNQDDLEPATHNLVADVRCELSR